VQDRRASAEFPEAKRLLGALANSRGHRHEENAARLVNTARDQPLAVGAALLASSEGYTPRANQLLDAAREQLGTIEEIAGALADNLPQPKLQPARRRRRKRKRTDKPGEAQNGAQQTATTAAPSTDGAPAAPKRKRRRRRKPASAAGNGESAPTIHVPTPPPAPEPSGD
jgi:hypothetical protein